MKRIGPWIAVAVVLAANATLLLGEWRNRRGVPEAEVTLTEREAPLAWRGREDSGMALRLDWNRGEPAPWFDEAKLRELGFDVAPPLDARSIEMHYDRVLPRNGFVVLETEGEAWERWLATQEDAIATATRRAEAGEDTAAEIERIRHGIDSHSRLFAVDAGLDPAELRRRHPDRERSLILPAVLALRVVPASAPDAEERHPARLEGFVMDVRTSTLHVPLARRAVLDAVAAGERDSRPPYAPLGTAPAAPRYEVAVAVGSRYRPWVRSVSALESATAP